MSELRFGLIGYGYFGKFHARAIRGLENCVLAAVASPSIGSVAEEELPASIKRYEDPKDLFKDTSIDCVVIAAPASAHLHLIEGAVVAQKHVLVEKPVVSDPKEIGPLKELLSGYPKTFMAGHIYFFNDYLAAAKKAISEGALGPIKNVLFKQTAPGPIRGDLDILWEFAPHSLSIMEYLFGPAKPIKVQGFRSGFNKEKSDRISFKVDFDNGIDASMDFSWFSPEKEKKITVIGEKGTMVFDDILKDLCSFEMPYPKEAAPNNRSSKFAEIQKKQLMERGSGRDPMVNELAEFAKCVREGREPITGRDHAFRILEALEFISNGIPA